MVHQWCIVLCNGYFKGTELYVVEKWVKVTTEGPETAYLPIKNLLIKNANNKEVPLEGEEDMRITPRATLHKNINELQA